jgi:hypothetical protein
MQDDLVRQLAERKIDLSSFGGVVQQAENGEGGKKLKENEQNSKNKAFEVKYSREIRRCVPFSVFFFGTVDAHMIVDL